MQIKYMPFWLHLLVKQLLGETEGLEIVLQFFLASV